MQEKSTVQSLHWVIAIYDFGFDTRSGFPQGADGCHAVCGTVSVIKSFRYSCQLFLKISGSDENSRFILVLSHIGSIQRTTAQRIRRHGCCLIRRRYYSRCPCCGNISAWLLVQTVSSSCQRDWSTKFELRPRNSASRARLVVRGFCLVYQPPIQRRSPLSPPPARTSF